MSYEKLELYSPDTIAECFEVSDELYRHLWNDVVPLYEISAKQLPQDGDSKFLRSLEPNSTGWLKYVDFKFKDELSAISSRDDGGNND